MATEPVLINGSWRTAQQVATVRAINPATGQSLSHEYPVSGWEDCDAALDAATAAAAKLAIAGPEVVARFLERFAEHLVENAATICDQAHLETALPVHPRLADVEMPRTINQLRLAAAAARDGSWRSATIDTKANIRSGFGPIGPVVVLGPNNFPFAFNAIAGGDFAAAIAAGNPVIAKAHPSHPRTSQLMAELAHDAASTVGLTPGAVQLIYKISRKDGTRLAADPRVGAVGFTGSRAGGMSLKTAADAVGKPIFLEMSSVNPVYFLPGAIKQRGTELVNEMGGSCLMGAGQFCTSPNLFVVLAGADSEEFINGLKSELASRPAGTLLSDGVLSTLRSSVESLRQAGAELVVGGQTNEGPGFSFQNTLLRVTGLQFMADPERLQTEAFGNATMAVVVDGIEQACEVARRLEGSLTGSIYSATDGSDDAAYDSLAPVLRRRVGRLLNDKMPTGVAVSPAMNHGGPFPATGHPGFTAVGIPASMRRFAMLECYDSVRHSRLPAWLQDTPPNPTMWRSVDGRWIQGSITSS
jgi:2,5-dioxopentanoate dehydrogenase